MDKLTKTETNRHTMVYEVYDLLEDSKEKNLNYYETATDILNYFEMRLNIKLNKRKLYI